MKKNIHLSIKPFLQKNGPLLGSVLAALLLYSAPSKILMLLELCIFAAVFLSVCLEENPADGRKKNPAAGFPAAAFSVIGFLQFTADRPGSIGFLMAALILSLGSFYAFYRLACRIDGLFSSIFHSTGHHASLGGRLFFTLSAAAFCILSCCGSSDRNVFCGILAATGLAALAASRLPGFLTLARDTSLVLRLYGLASAIGVCLAQYSFWPGEYQAAALLLSGLSIPFVMTCIWGMARKLGEFFLPLYASLNRKERCLYSIVLLAGLVFTAVVFFHTDAFYGTEHSYDIIYTADSPTLVRENAYLLLKHPQNDLRQPLFAVFCGPFLGTSYLVSRLFSLAPAWHALLMNLPQVVLLFVSHLLLATACGFQGMRRAGFVLLLCFAYPSLLFMLAMEQYIMAYFYVCLSVYAFSQQRTDHVAYWGASGTLLTSAVLLPLLSRKNPFRQFRSWFHDMANGGIGLIVAILAFSRGEVLLEAVSSFLNLNRFSGISLTFMQKLSQFTAFLVSCVAAPGAHAGPNMWGVMSWQLDVPQGIAPAGVLIALLCILSVILNRKNPITWISGLWVLFAAGVLLVFGWGTQENGLILYALYFGWAFLLLLYQLLERILAALRMAHLSGIFGILGAACLAAVNLPAIGYILQFAMAHYPL